MTPAPGGVADVVRPPRTDEPAIHDDTTAKLFAHMVVLTRSLPWSVLTILGGAAAAVWLATVQPFVGGLVGLAVAFCCRQVVAGPALPIAGWPEPALRLLAEQSWRAVLVTAVHSGVLELGDGTQVRVWAMPTAAREVVARTGRVWLVGPDTRGWLALRVDGLHTPWPARITTRGPADRLSGVRLPAAGPTGVVDGLWSDPATTGRRLTPVGPLADPMAVLVRHVVGRKWGDLVFTSVLMAALVVVAVLTDAGPHAWLVPLAAVVALGVVAHSLWRMRAVRELAALVHAGPWQRADATLPSWHARQRGRGDGTATVRVPNGERFTVDLRAVHLDVLANMCQTESVWIAGTPTHGATRAVGFPGYPIVATAHFTTTTEPEQSP
jgi:hypothetical protein